jgi:threonine/homoserine/homoserine lactone efflux protein
MLLTLFIITLLASISPGPDFIVVMRNALISRSSGVAASIAIGFAELIHVSYCIAGLGIIISQSILLFQIIKIA